MKNFLIALICLVGLVIYAQPPLQPRVNGITVVQAGNGSATNLTVDGFNWVSNPFRLARLNGVVNMYSVGTSHTWGQIGYGATNYTDGGGRLLAPNRYVDMLGNKYGFTFNNYGVSGSTMHYNYGAAVNQLCHFNVLGFYAPLTGAAMFTIDGGYNDALAPYDSSGWNYHWKANKVAMISRALIDYYTGVGTSGKDSSGNAAASFATSGTLVTDVDVGAMDPFPGADANRLAVKLTGSQYYNITLTNWSTAAFYFDASDTGGIINVYTNGVQAAAISSFMPASVAGDKMPDAVILRNLTNTTVIGITNQSGTNLMLAIGRIPQPATNRFVVLNTVPQTASPNRNNEVMLAMDSAIRAAASEFANYNVYVAEIGSYINPKIDIVNPLVDPDHMNPWGQLKMALAYENAYRMQSTLENWQQKRSDFMSNVSVDSPSGTQPSGIKYTKDGTIVWGIYRDDGGNFYLQKFDATGAFSFNGMKLDGTLGDMTVVGDNITGGGFFATGLRGPPLNTYYVGGYVSGATGHIQAGTNAAYANLQLDGSSVSIKPAAAGIYTWGADGTMVINSAHVFIPQSTSLLQLNENYIQSTGLLADTNKPSFAYRMGSDAITFYYAPPTNGIPAYTVLFNIDTNANVSALSYAGAGTGLTGTAVALSIGGNSGTSTLATNSLLWNSLNTNFLNTNVTGTGFVHVTGGTKDAAARAIVLSTADVTGNLAVTHLNGATGADATTFWRGDGTWAVPATNSSSFGLGITNNGSVISNNIVAGTNLVIVAGANGQLQINSVSNAASSGTVGTLINVAATTAGQLVQFSDTQQTNTTPVTVGLGLTNNAGVLSNNIVAGTNVTILEGANGQLTIHAGSIGGGTGSVTSVAMTVPAFLSVAGSPITSAGTLAVSLSGTALPVANGGTGFSNRTLRDSAGTPIVSLDWDNRLLEDAVGGFSLDYGRRLADDTNGLNSLSWDTRKLFNSSGATVLDWSGNLTGLGLTNRGATLSNNIVAGSGVSITAGSSGQLTIAASGFGGGQNLVTKTADYTLTSADDTVVFTLNAGVTATLPTAVGIQGKIFRIKCDDLSGGVHIVTTGGQAIDTLSSYTTSDMGCLTVQSDGTQWKILSVFKETML